MDGSDRELAELELIVWRGNEFGVIRKTTSETGGANRSFSTDSTTEYEGYAYADSMSGLKKKTAFIQPCAGFSQN